MAATRPELRMLLLEDEQQFVTLVVKQLEEGGFEVRHTHVETRGEFLAALNRESWHIVIADYVVPGFGAPDALHALLESGRDIPFIVVSGYIDEQIASDLMRSGADDFVSKADLSRLAPAVRRAVADANERNLRREAEAGRIRTDQNLRTVIQESVDGMLVLSVEGSVLFANPAIELLLGRNQVELLGREFGIPASGTRGEEIQVLRSDGHISTVEMRGTPTEWDARPATVLTLRDITERKKAEENLRVLNRTLRVLSRGNRVLPRARSEKELLSEVCRIIVEDGGYTFCWVGLLGLDGDNVLYPACWHGADQGYLEELDGQWTQRELADYSLWRQLRRGELAVVQDIAAGAGAESWRELALRCGFNAVLAIPLAADGGLLGAIYIFAAAVDAFNPDEMNLLDELASDLAFGINNLRRGEERRAMETRLRDSEEQIRQLQKLESVGRLAGGIAHDFNNMLHAMGGYIELALTEVQEESRLHLDITAMRQLVERASSLTQQLLAFSRRQTLQREVLDLNEEIKESLKLLRRLIGENIAIAFDPAPEIAPVFADPGQMYQVILNLAVNARDAMPGGGELHITTANRIISSEIAESDPNVEPGDFVEITIRDTGEGMAEEVRDRIFEPFFTTKELGEGTGLGLSTVYGIVKQHGGHIGVESEPGQGAVFRVALPACEEMPEQPAAPAAEVIPEQQGGRTILIAEDEEAVRFVLTRMLQKFGYQVLTAETAHMALQLAETHKEDIDLLIADVVMPDISGPDLHALIREHNPELPVLFMSGYADDTVFKHGVIKEGTPFIQKPFSSAKLLEQVEAALRIPE